MCYVTQMFRGWAQWVARESKFGPNWPLGCILWINCVFQLDFSSLFSVIIEILLEQSDKGGTERDTVEKETSRYPIYTQHHTVKTLKTPPENLGL